ncbi:hypothetical protein LuPra_04345 [Luteitalea pratensis]|uniref:Uncharacterized protein n=1 Tax=Luteitalea pratensis TaxID=1855912 RepID=A0A143PSN1_LUTPR|nr:hypothetical protein [Luteitalea pratensis]AMY11100.1 hypothetical protein LuPra_04345 [Luteitalea pratensis]
MRFAEDMSRQPRGLLQRVVKATGLRHANIETYLDKLGGGLTALPPE